MGAWAGEVPPGMELKKRGDILKCMPREPLARSERIRRRIDKAKPGWVFTPFDFLDFGSPYLVGMVLLRLMRKGLVRRLTRGLYDIPRKHPQLGDLSPAAEEIARAVARRDGATIQPSEATAANLLHLTEQVPARIEYETDGPSRVIRVGKLTIKFRKRPRRKLGSVAPVSSMVFAGLRNLGRSHATVERVRHLRDSLKPDDRRQLLVDLPSAPVWMHPLLRSLVDEEAEPRNRKKTKRASKTTAEGPRDE